MNYSRLLVLTAFISATSFSSFAGVSFKQKQMRVESLVKLQNLVPNLAFDAYQRELGYEARNLSIDARAKNETNLLADKIRNQVTQAYKAALENKLSPELAREEIKTNMEKDLELAAPELKNELLSLANLTLDSIDAGGASEEVEYQNIESVMKKEVIKRTIFLNTEDQEMIVGPLKSKKDSNDDSKRLDYNSTEELLSSLVSDRESSRWVSSSNQTIRTATITKIEANISLQVKFEFLGASVEAGPSISFKRQYSTNADIMAEGLTPVLMNDGNFDYWKRDRAGKVIIEDGIAKKRYVSFACSTQLEFSTDYKGSGGFKFMGVGADASISRTFANTVTLASRRIALPESVANKSTTVKYISALCHNDFLKAKFNNTMTIKDSLNIMMKNMVAGLTFSHPKTKCATDDQCSSWFDNEVISVLKNNNVARCSEESGREKFRACHLRGLKGQNCPVFEGGKRTSSGEFEYSCDIGLKCVKYKNESTILGAVWSHSKGKCQLAH